MAKWSLITREKGLPDSKLITTGPYEDSIPSLQLQGMSAVTGNLADVKDNSHTSWYLWGQGALIG